MECTASSMDVALDGQLMQGSLDTEEGSHAPDTPTTSWLVPSSVNVRRWNELHVDFGCPTLQASSTTTVERLGTFVSAVKEEKDAGETYPGAVWRAINGMFPEKDETETTVESAVTLKGVQVRSGEEGEQTLAVGVGAQLLPNKAQPEGLSNVYERTVEGMREVEGEVVEEIRRGEERVEEVGIGLSVARDALGSAPGRVEEEREVLRREGGWRSSAFDVL